MRRPEVVVLALLVALARGRLFACRLHQDRAGAQGITNRTNEPVVVRESARGPQAFDRAQLRSPCREERLRTGDYAAAEKYARQALKQRSEFRRRLHAARGDRRFAGPARAGGRALQARAELAPADGRVLNNYGTWLCGNGQAQADRSTGSTARCRRRATQRPRPRWPMPGSCALDVGDNRPRRSRPAPGARDRPGKSGRPGCARAPAIPRRATTSKHARSPSAAWRLPRRTPKR